MYASDISAFQTVQKEGAWLQKENAHGERPQGSRQKKTQRKKGSLCVISYEKDGSDTTKP